MPEGPEIRVTAFVLNQLSNNYLKYVTSYGKRIIMVFEDKVLVSSLGMEGRWLIDKPRTKHTITQIDIGGHILNYDDVRKFGKIKEYNNIEDVKRDLNIYSMDWMQHSLDIYGIDDGLVKLDINNNFNIINTINPIKSKRKIADVLLDQHYFNGIGNYIKSEVLYKANIDPYRLINTLNEFELKKLHDSITSTMVESYKNGGFTLKSFCDPYGNPGRYKPVIYGIGKKLYINGRVTYIADTDVYIKNTNEL